MYNLFRNARIHNSDACRYDTNEGYALYWDVDYDFKGYTVYSNLTARIVCNGYLFAVNTDPLCYISSATDVVALDATANNIIKVGMRIDSTYTTVLPTTARIDFRTSDDVGWEAEKTKTFTIEPDNAYREYVIDMSEVQEWQGDVVRFRLWPTIDGDSGQKIHVRYIKASSTSTYICATKYYGTLCSKYSSYSHPCPHIGTGGMSKGTALSNSITIQEGVNDKIIVDMNDFGNQTITLDPIVGGSRDIISKDIEYKLNMVGVGGYSGALCYVEDNALVIETSTREVASSVSVTAPTASGSALLTLGFGASINSLGVEAASRYEPEGPFVVSATDISSFYNEDKPGNVPLFSIDSFRYFPQGGYSEYSDISRETKLDFSDQTFIDYNNPISENGTIVFAAYSGDANTTSEFRIYRQNLVGDISYVDGVNVGSTLDGNLDKIFEIECSIRVQKGDLVGLYDAAIHLGKETDNPDFSYYLYDGDLLTSTPILPLYGNGNRGAAIFCRGQNKTNKAVVVIEFDSDVSVESINISADEDVVEESIPLTQVSSGGPNGGPYITGYTGYGEDGTKAPDWTGLSYLTDGDKQDVNGESGVAYPLWWGSSDYENYDYTEAGFSLDFATGSPVFFDINRVVLYFHSTGNIKSFSIDYPYVTSDDDTEQAWDQVGGFSSVYLDGVLADSTRYLYTNPAYVSVDRYHEDYSALEYSSIDFRFSPVRARSIRYRGYLDISEDQSNPLSSVYAKFPIYIDPKIQEIEVYAISIPDKDLSDNFEVYSCDTDGTYIQHLDIDSLSSTDVRFIIGYPVSKLKLVVNAFSTTRVNKVSSYMGQSSVSTDTNGDFEELSILAPTNDPSSVVETILVSNDSENVSNFYIDIVDENVKKEGCILWNKLDSEESIIQSEIGSGGVLYKRDNFSFKTSNVALGQTAYVMSPNFLATQACYISYDHRSTWERMESDIVNGNKLDYVTNESAYSTTYSYVYVCISCGDSYDFLSVTPVSALAYDVGWDTSIWYSQSTETDPNNIDTSSWILSSSYSARWISLRCRSTAVGSASLLTLAYVIPILDISRKNNFGKFPWVEEGHLTNGISGVSTAYAEAWTSSGKYYYHCVDLEKRYPISNVIIGPASCGDSTDAMGCTSLDADGKSDYVAYSAHDVDDPNDVRWSSFGAAPSGADRWVLVRSAICDEIAVFIDQDTTIYNPFFSSTAWWSSKVNDVYVDDTNYSVPFSSIALDYPANSALSEYMKLSANLGYDNNLAARDAFACCLYVSDITQMDLSYGYIGLFKSTSESLTFNAQTFTEDSTNGYAWDMDTISGSLVSGWNALILPFKSYNMVGSPGFITDISTTAEKRRNRFTHLAVSFRGTGTNPAFKTAIDNIEILRSYYPAAKFGSGLYLAGSEYLKFFVNNFDPFTGCIEFFLEPDWSRFVNCNTCIDAIPHTIFSIVDSYGYLFTMIMTTSGFRIFLTNGETTLSFLDNSLIGIAAGERSHLAISWNFEASSDSLFEIYVNNVLSSSYLRSSLQGDFDLSGHSSGAFLILGGKAWDGYSSNDQSGLDGVVDNLRMYNYYKSDFSSTMGSENPGGVLKSRDLIEVSTDGIVFYDYYSENIFPIVIENVAPSSTFPIYVRPKNIDKTSDGEYNRKSYIEILRMEI
jgi:hypothetical protein